MKTGKEANISTKEKQEKKEVEKKKREKKA